MRILLRSTTICLKTLKFQARKASEHRCFSRFLISIDRKKGSSGQDPLNHCLIKPATKKIQVASWIVLFYFKS